jgi:hypothetical protein
MIFIANPPEFATDSAGKVAENLAFKPSGLTGTGHGSKLLGSAEAPLLPNFDSGLRSWMIGPPSLTLGLSLPIALSDLALSLSLNLSLSDSILCGRSGKKNREEK